MISGQSKEFELEKCKVTPAVLEDLDRLKRFRELGVARMNVRLPPAKADEILPVLDRWAKLIPQLK